MIISNSIAPIFGDGSDGNLTVATDVTLSVVNVSCSGTAGSTTLSATGDFAAGDKVLIHQSRGTGVGAWETNFVVSYSAGSITLLNVLANTYTDSGASQAQVLVLKEYSSVTVNSGATLLTGDWGGDTGGILAFMCSGRLTVTGSVSATGTGFRGSTASVPVRTTGTQGEGTSGVGSQGTGANGNGGGGGQGTTYPADGAGGAGGGNGVAGSNGTNSRTGHSGGTGGAAAGSADLTTMIFGGGGGSGGGDDTTGTGGGGADGGGIIAVFAKEIVITGSMVSGGNNGSNASDGSAGSGGAGAGGSIFLQCQTATLGASLVQATGGVGAAVGGAGGNGGAGRIRVESCKSSGESSPAASIVQGGYSYCGSLAAIIG